MDIQELCTNYRIATSNDLEVLLHLANTSPQKIFVRDMFHDQIMSFTDFAEGTFQILSEENNPVILGQDSKTKTAAKFRIVNDVVQVVNDTFKTWTAPSLGGIRLYIPKQKPE